jgi:hypothetical protein
VCRRWAYVTRTAAALWETVELSLKLPDPGILERTECFLSWLIPRAAAVEKLGILATRESAAAAATAAGASTAFGPLHLQLVWSNLVSALTLMGPTLRHVTIEWPDDLQLSAWVATLVALEVRCAALCCAVLHWAELCCAVLCCAVLRCTATCNQVATPDAAAAAGRCQASRLITFHCLPVPVCMCSMCCPPTADHPPTTVRSLAASQPPASPSGLGWAAWRHLRCGSCCCCLLWRKSSWLVWVGWVTSASRGCGVCVCVCVVAVR